MIKLGKGKKTLFTLVAVFDKSKMPKEVLQEKNTITVFPTKQEAYIYLGKKADYTVDTLKTAIKKIVAENKRGFNVDASTFIAKNVKEEQVTKLFIEDVMFQTTITWNKKTGKDANKKAKEIILINVEKAESKEIAKESLILAEAQAFVRNAQNMAPNECTSTILADIYKKEFDGVSNVSVKVLKKSEIEKLGMGLLLAVNMGSNDDARVVVMEYKGDKSSKEKTVMVGKGITFDAGGMNIKTGRNILGMKYDMSGSAVVVGAMKAISQFKPKANISIVAPLTDNKVSKTAGLPDSVWTSMNGKTVEINNTDAEGRLVLADGITYAVRKLNATRIIDVATLTGAVLVALGNTYTGVWATEDADWKMVEKTAAEQNELVWRMPFHSDFSRFIKNSNVADLKNTDLTGMGGSSSAAMFLKEFTEDVPYIHFDIAGTADVKGDCMGPLVKTLAKLIK
ncbi:M17 family metallopeptidase [Mycoplasma todarodis]|uniref:Probable cytosol aminopeptidase n=1 Tax=Mycoplasma todarodis TaxID=1937191 RepID=A0A4R0XKA9_9MOLU|nr:leucyl aminopeptidase family protein [Mycoplasma todarodis]TCG11086.1 peptidase M17 [Mycoplasma todarodis]